MGLKHYNYGQLAADIARMKPRSALYKTIKASLKARGNWKDRPRGIPIDKVMAVKPIYKSKDHAIYGVSHDDTADWSA